MSGLIKVGIIGGSGLDNPNILANRTEKTVNTPFGQPSDSLILGEIDDVPCVLLARHGRKHNVMPGNINYRANIWALKQEGCTHILATNACGSLREDLPPGMIVIPDGFLDRTTNRQQTFYDGEPTHPQGICHLPIEPPFHPDLRQVILEAACSIGLDNIRNGGCIVTIEGPRYCCKYESKFYKQMGCHLIGMTTVPEVVLAKEAGIIYAAIAMITDYDCWRDSGEKVTHATVMKVFQENIQKVITLLRAVISMLREQYWTEQIDQAQQLAIESVH